MRVPYIVGRWVRGRDHYGRQRPITHIIQAEDPAIWIVGTRRMGKTSLLRQLELATDKQESRLVPLFWDLQGCESFDDLSYELVMALEDAAERFESLGVDIDALDNKDAIAILRRLNRTLLEYGKQLLLLIDEAEVLIKIADNEPKWIARLRKAFQSGQQRTVITSTKLLSQLNHVGPDFNTSPFLFGFSLVNLWSLDIDASTALARQEQSADPIEIEDSLLENILTDTNRHPYLLQYLCHRLYTYSETDTGTETGIVRTLRNIEPYDLAADHLLAGFFQVDFSHLTTVERRILLTVSQMTIASDEQVIAELSDVSPHRIGMFLYGMEKLGYVRKTFGQWAVGNEFLRLWLQENHAELSPNLESPLDDGNIETMLKMGRENELNYLNMEMARLEGTLAALKEQRTQLDARQPNELSQQILRVSTELSQIQRELENVPG